MRAKTYIQHGVISEVVREQNIRKRFNPRSNHEYGRNGRTKELMVVDHSKTARHSFKCNGFNHSAKNSNNSLM